MSWSRNILAATTLWLSFQATAGCNAVLGIEQAELDTELDGTISPVSLCPPRQAPPPTDCPVCEPCQTACSDLAETCFGDHECRVGVQEYRRCLGDKCTDKGGTCQTCLSGNANLHNLAVCVAAKCEAGCSVANLLSPCDEYCRCMGAQCQAEQPDGAAGCVKACESGSTSTAWQAQNQTEFAKWWQVGQAPWRPYCLLDHCELATSLQNQHHCGHAIGRGPQCDNPPVLKTSPECPSRTKYGGAACETDEECCGVCGSDFRCTDPG